MHKLLIVGVAALLLLGLVLTWSAPHEPSPAEAYLAFQRAEIQAEQEAADSARWAGVWDVALPLGVVLVGVVLVGLVVAGGWALYERRRPLVQLDALALPVDRRALHRGTYAQLPYALLEYRTQAAIAAGPQVPSHLTLHQAYRNDVQGVPERALAAPAFVPPSIGEAAERGAFRDGRYILGYGVGDGRALTLDQADGRSLLIAGQGGSGGTTYLLGSALQEILMPFYLPGQQEAARFILVDYHAAKTGSLTQRAAGLGERVIYAAHTPAEVERAAGLFQQECRARIAGKRAAYPLVLLCDEVGNMVDDGDYSAVIKPLLKTFTFANNAARAVGGKAIVRGHTLQSSAWGNTATVRQSFHARAGMRLDADAAGLLGIRPALAREMIALPAGRAFVTGPGLSLTEAVASNVRGDDVSRVLDLAGYRANARTVQAVAQPSKFDNVQLASEPGGTNDNVMNSTEPEEIAAGDADRGVLLTGNWWDQVVADKPEASTAATPESAPEAGLQAPAPDLAYQPEPEALRAYALFMTGHDVSRIVLELRGIDTGKAGAKGQQASREIQALIRQEIARRRAQGPTEGVSI